jgi:hypothetical protein
MIEEAVQSVVGVAEYMRRVLETYQRTEKCAYCFALLATNMDTIRDVYVGGLDLQKTLGSSTNERLNASMSELVEHYRKMADGMLMMLMDNPAERLLCHCIHDTAQLPNGEMVPVTDDVLQQSFEADERARQAATSQASAARAAASQLGCSFDSGAEDAASSS